MAERTPRAVLNDLIGTCRDAARGFQHAAELVRDPSLKKLLIELADARQSLASQLEPHAQRLGGDAASKGTAAAAVHRRWMDIKSALTSHDDQAVMTEVRRGDGVTLRLFAEALAEMLPASVRDTIEHQDIRVRADHLRIERAMSGARVQTLL
jgi:uncharacterized protein (TIGR02284 family)